MRSIKFTAIPLPRHRIPLATLVVSLGITFLLGLAAVGVERDAGHKEFRRLAEKFRGDLSNQIQAHIDTIPTLKAFMVLERNPNDARVDQFISAVSLRQRFPNLAFIFLAERIPLGRRDAYVAQVRRDNSVFAAGRPDFAITPPGDRPEYMVIRHVSPERPNTVGYDLYDPTHDYRRDADLAVMTGRTIATGPLVLAADRGSPRNQANTSIVVRAAVYTDNVLPPTAPLRAQYLQGLVGIAFKTERLIENVRTGAIASDLDMRITDREEAADALPIYQSPVPAGRASVRRDHDDVLVLDIPVANRHWSLQFRDRVPQAEFWLRPVPLVILGAGAAISLLLWLLMRALVTRTQLAEAAVEDALVLVRGEQAALEEAQAIAAIGSFEWRPRERALRWSAQMVRLYGCSADDFIRDRSAVKARIPAADLETLQAAFAGLIHDRTPLACEHRLQRDDGQTLRLQVRSKWQYDASGRPAVLTGTAQDVTALRQHEAEILHLAFVDSLTGLPNRRRVIDVLGSLIDTARRDGVFHALLFVDLDNFKTINDSKGHAVGDKMLRHAAERLLAIVSNDDMVARIGGDEFVILVMTEAHSARKAAEIAAAIAERVRNTLAAPFILDSITHVSGASIGVSVFPQPGQQHTDIFREADTAMYRSKEAGRNCVTVFEQSMHDEVERKSAFELDLAAAVEARQLHLVAQTQFDVLRRPCGAELLLRWTHPSGENIAPDRFIPVAEETGLIVELGAYVFERGCALVLELAALGRSETISINVSPRQFRQPGFVEYVKQAVTRLALPPGRLVFEVTEGLLIEDVAQTARRMHELSALGIRFSIDDFGTGYSSLAYLRDLPLSELKIDRSFIHAALTNANDAAIVKLILGVAAQLDIKVVAEGVETDAQFDFLAKNGCDAMQGFLLARPVRLEEWIGTRGTTHTCVEQ